MRFRDAGKFERKVVKANAHPTLASGLLITIVHMRPVIVQSLAIGRRRV